MVDGCRKSWILVAVVLPWVGGACAATLAPVNNILDAPIHTVSGSESSLDQVRQAVFNALQTKKWRVDKDQPGVIEASYSIAEHEVHIRVDFSGQSYSITHVSSSPSLKYDGQNIHRRYNHWIRLLDEAIRRELGSL